MNNQLKVQITPGAYAVMAAWGITVPHPVTPVRIMTCGHCYKQFQVEPCQYCDGKGKVITMYRQRSA